jgi:hypothetical protein
VLSHTVQEGEGPPGIGGGLGAHLQSVGDWLSRVGFFSSPQGVAFLREKRRDEDFPTNQLLDRLSSTVHRAQVVSELSLSNPTSNLTCR